MAEIHVLSTRECSSSQAARLLTDLQLLQSHGSDLGSRVPHIQAAGDVLRQMADQFADQIACLGPTLRQLGPNGQHVIERLDTLLQNTRHLADSAQRFPAGQ